MYIAKVLVDKKPKGIKIYEKYEHALSDVINSKSELYSGLPNNKRTNFNNPVIYSASRNRLGYNVDFEFRYSNGVTVCVEEIMSEESFRREVTDV